MTRNAENRDMSPARKEPDTNTFPGRIAVRLRALREKAGLTPEEVAEKMGVTVQTVYHWERARSFPKLEQLLLLANILGLKSIRTLLPER